MNSKAVNLELARNCVMGFSRARMEMALWPRTKPIISPTFSPLGAHLGTLVLVRRGLDSISHVVMLPETRLVLVFDDSRADALHLARTLVNAVGHGRILQWAEEFRSEWSRPFEVAELAPLRGKRVQQISRRRREIFNKSNGLCHYCGTTLLLDGKWHIEHKLPRALGGDNHPDNLTAACVPCNLAKRDRTDAEFIAARSAA